MSSLIRFGSETESLVVGRVRYKEFRLAGLGSPRADVGNGNSFVDVDGNTLCKSAFPAGFHSYAPTFYANSRTSANRSPIRKWRTTTPRNAAVATLPFSSHLLPLLSNHTISRLCHVHVVRSRRETVIWRYYLLSFYIGEPIVKRGKASIYQGSIFDGIDTEDCTLRQRRVSIVANKYRDHFRAPVALKWRWCRFALRTR